MRQPYARDVFISFAIQILENGRSLLLIPVLAKTIGTSGYGIWVQVKIGIVFLCPFLLLGFGGGVSRFLPGSSKSEIKDGMFSSSVAVFTIGAGLASLLILSEGIIQKYLESIPNRGLFIKGLAILFVAEPLNNLFIEYFRSFRKMKSLSGLVVFDTIFEFGPVFWTAYNGFGVGVVVFSFTCGRLISTVVKGLLIFREVGFGNFKRGIIEKFIKFGFPLIWSNIFFYIVNYLDRYLIGYFYSTKEVGIYSLAYSIGYVVVLVSAPWDRVLMPTITAHWNKGEIECVRYYFTSTIRYMLIITVPLAVFLSCVSVEIVKLLSTSEFSSAIYMIPVMLLTFLIFELSVFSQRIVALVHGSIKIIKCYGIVAVISTVLNILLVPKFSIVGAGIAMLLSYTTLYILFYLLAIKRITFESQATYIIKIFFGTIPGLLILLFFNHSTFLKLLLHLLFSLILYVTILWIIGIVGKKEFVFAKSLFHRNI